MYNFYLARLEQEFWHSVLLAPDTLQILESLLVSEQLQFLEKEMGYKKRYTTVNLSETQAN